MKNSPIIKFIIALVLIALTSVAACLYLEWWSIAICAALVAVVIPQKPILSFAAGFLSLFLTWGGLAYFISSNNDHLLAHKVSLLILKADNPMLLILATALIGGLVAGLAALAGSFIRPAEVAQNDPFNNPS
ncbi:MAG: hypothetical protein RLY16_2487 [Bacteroidota bacterium]